MSTTHKIDSEEIIDVRFMSDNPVLHGVEYSTTMRRLRERVRDAGLKITKTEWENGKISVYVCPRYKGIDPYLSTETYAGYGSTFQGTRFSRH